MAKKKAVKRKPKLLPPDWAGNTSSHSPGSPDQVPKPWVREFPRPDGKRRRVQMRLWIWSLHHHASLEEDDNRLWNSLADPPYRAGGSWTVFYEDKEAKGRKFFNFSRSRNRALKWIVLKFLKEFDTKTHVLVNQFGEPIDPKTGKVLPENLWVDGE